METPDAIRPVDEVVREYVLATVTAFPKLPQYQIAARLGWSPSTLCRRLQGWMRESDEDVVRDRR